MTNITLKLTCAALAGCLMAPAASAEPIPLSDAELGAIVGGSIQFVEGFVCPVIITEAVTNSPKGAAIGEGHYTILGPDVRVPMRATNSDGEGGPAGSGTPPGPHAQPGDVGYTAIWGLRP